MHGRALFIPIFCLITLAETPAITEPPDPAVRPGNQFEIDLNREFSSNSSYVLYGMCCSTTIPRPSNKGGR